jgi:hypothetical protein
MVEFWGLRLCRSMAPLAFAVGLISVGLPWTSPRANPVVVADSAYVYTRVEGRSASWIPYGLGSSAQSPKAIRFVGRHDRTYVVYADRNAHPMICYYDHLADRWSDPVRVGRSSRPGNPHSVPALAITADGHLHVFYGSHGSVDLMRRSSMPESTARWDSLRVVSSMATYHNVFAVGDVLYLLQRDRTSREPRWGLKVSSDGGETWSAHRELFAEGADRAYPTLLIHDSGAGPIMHMFWLIYSRKDGWRDMRYARSADLGHAWEGAGGEPLADPIPLHGGDLVYSGPTHGWQNEIVVDSAGNPALLFVTGGTDVVDDNVAMFARWADGRWRVTAVCPADSRYGHGTVLLRDDTLAVYFAAGTWQGGEITEWVSADDGVTWQWSRQLTHESPTPNNYPEPVINRSPEVEVLWCSGSTTRNGRIHAWGSAAPPEDPGATDPGDGTQPGQPDRGR